MFDGIKCTAPGCRSPSRTTVTADVALGHEAEGFPIWYPPPPDAKQDNHGSGPVDRWFPGNYVMYTRTEDEGYHFFFKKKKKFKAEKLS